MYVLIKAIRLIEKKCDVKKLDVAIFIMAAIMTVKALFLITAAVSSFFYIKFFYF